MKRQILAKLDEMGMPLWLLRFINTGKFTRSY